MKKQEIATKIFEQKGQIYCSVVRVYGVTNGVGYDLNVVVVFKNGFEKRIEAHALRTGWAYPSHLRPNNPYYKYSGSNDVYQSQVVGFWQNGDGFLSYLQELKKADLEALLEEIKEA